MQNVLHLIIKNMGELDLILLNEALAQNKKKSEISSIYSNKEIKKTDLLINLIQTYDLSKKITNVEFSIEIDENNNIGDDNMPCFKKILQPARGDFGIYVFIPENGTISLEQYPKNLEIKYELEKFNIDSAYCNSPNSLFISGGRFNEEKITRFWVIDNEIYSIKKNDL